MKRRKWTDPVVVEAKQRLSALREDLSVLRKEYQQEKLALEIEFKDKRRKLNADYEERRSQSRVAIQEAKQYQ